MFTSIIINVYEIQTAAACKDEIASIVLTDELDASSQIANAGRCQVASDRLVITVVGQSQGEDEFIQRKRIAHAINGYTSV